MGCCATKDSTTAYKSPGKGDRPTDSSPPPGFNREHRKGSIAAFSPQAKQLKNLQVDSWEIVRRSPICGESFKPERQVAGRRTSVVSVPKHMDELHFIVSCMQEHPLFAHLSRDAISELASVMVPVTYPKNATVYFAWEPGEDLYLIRRGRVRFSQGEKDQPAASGGPGAGRKI